MFNYFHRLFNPHCPHCIEQEREAKVCDTCEVLKLEIERLRNENLRLLELLLRNGKESIEPNTEELRPLPVTNKHVPWNIRKQMLEAEDRAKTKLIRSNPILSTTDVETGKISTETLENEILGQEG